MPRFSVWSIRAALLYLAAGFTLGALLLANKGIPFYPRLWSLLPAHIEFLLLGWIVQLVIGMAFWILPRFRQAPKRGNENLAWLSLGLLNLGIWLAGAVPVFWSAAWLPIAGRAAEVFAALVFCLYAWPRVKPPGA